MKLYFFLFIILFSELFSSDWKYVQNTGTLPLLFYAPICCPDSNNCFALAQHTLLTRLYKSSNAGQNWDIVYESDPINEGFPYLVNARWGFSPNPDYYYMVMSERPVIKKSINGGISFKKIELDTMDSKPERDLWSLSMYDNNIGFINNADFEFITKDGWETFEKYPNDLTRKGLIRASMFLNDSILLGVCLSYTQDSSGAVASVLRLLNINRPQWKTIYEFPGGIEPEQSHTIMNIIFINDSLGFVCGYQYENVEYNNRYGIIYRTTDGGYSWKLILKELEGFHGGFRDIAFADAKNGVAVGEVGKIYKTNDSGNTWILNEVPEKMELTTDLRITWAGHYPLIATAAGGEGVDENGNGIINSGIFRYEGDFFDFSPDPVFPVIQADDYDFGTIDIRDSLLVVQKIKIHNLSTDTDLIISGFSNLNEWAFTNEFTWLDTMTNITVKPSDFFELPVSFKPDEVRKYIDSIIVYSNAIGQDSIIVLEGEGIDTSTSVYDEFITKKGISISPNPASEYIEINFLENSRWKGDIRVYNILGECVLFVGTSSESAQSKKIDVSKLPQGFYFVKIDKYVVKFLKY